MNVAGTRTALHELGKEVGAVMQRARSNGWSNRVPDESWVEGLSNLGVSLSTASSEFTRLAPWATNTTADLMFGVQNIGWQGGKVSLMKTQGIQFGGNWDEQFAGTLSAIRAAEDVLARIG